jgi:hypothetical protein
MTPSTSDRISSWSVHAVHGMFDDHPYGVKKETVADVNGGNRSRYAHRLGLE